MNNVLIETLVETRLNGNQIKNNATYLNMLKRITIENIINYISSLDLNVSTNNLSKSRKLDLIERISKYYANKGN